jgi:hypothetical protein
MGMKKSIIAICGILLSGTISFAQQTGSASANSRLGIESGTNVDAELQSTVDVKKAKVGDQVILKTRKAIKRNGQTVLPKGTNLIGRITQVQQKTKENASSKISMVFDRAQGGDLAGPINASIVAITSAQTSAALGDTMDTGISGGSTSSGRVSSSGSGSSGGGLLGGVTNTVGGVTNAAGQTLGGVTNTAGSAVGGVAGTASNTVSGTTGAVRQTINGINISQSASGSLQNSTTLSSPNKNIKLDKGVTFQLRFNENR